MTEIKASCQCGQLTVKSTVSTESIPLDMYLCSCNICRWLSGQLAISSVNLHQPLEVHGEVARYATSTGARGLDRCFCPTCGTFVYEDCLDPTRIGLFGGAMEEADGLVQFKGTIYAASTIDGGLTTWLPNYPAFVEEFKGDKVQQFTPPTRVVPSDPRIDPQETLLGSCHCGGYQFKISRPNKASYELTSEYSDSLMPRHEGKEHLNPRNEKWWIRCNGTKYAAAVCACVSCRKSSGQDLVQWAFIPAANILAVNGSPFDLRSGTLTSYASSGHAKRYFCKVCGAKVFLTEDRPDLIDVSVGLLRSEQGSKAEDWLEWFTQRISFIEEAQNLELTGAMQAGMKSEHAAKGD